MMNGFNDLIYAEGFAARFDGRCLDDAPAYYTETSRMVWQAGWQKAEAEANTASARKPRGGDGPGPAGD